MAISIKNYVDIRSAIPSGISGSRSLGGLVISAAEMVGTADPDIKAAYDSGEIIPAGLDETKSLFGEDDAYTFASRYYGYISPSGGIPTSLKFCKLLTNVLTYAEYSANVAYEVGDLVSYDDVNYKCITAVTSEQNTAFEAIVDNFEISTATKVTEKALSAFNRSEASLETFGSFTFLDTEAHTFTQEELKEVATYNTGLGNKYLFVVNDVRGTKSRAEVVGTVGAFKASEGTCFVSGGDKFSAYMPMSIFGATPYNDGQVTVQMFKQFNSERPTVVSDGDYMAFKENNINFYGRTQSNGSTIDFYQCGYNTDGVDTAIYCNELWFKSACETAIVDLLMSSERVPANDEGVALVSNVVGTVCGLATSNGTFMPKAVSKSAESEIRSIVNRIGGAITEASAVISGIANVGFSVYASLQPRDNGEYAIRYYVFYGTADSIRFVQGNDVGIK